MSDEQALAAFRFRGLNTANSSAVFFSLVGVSIV
jgi:hypothetical protein